MIFTVDVVIRIVIMVLGLCGFVIARYIRSHKTQDTPLVCMVGFDCHAVVHSDYSKFLGMPVEFLGMLYYSLVSIGYLFFTLVPSVMSTPLINILVGASFIAFLFSLYLIGVQIFILKKGCSWCIMSSIISALIFIFSAMMYHPAYLSVLFG